MEDMVGKRLGRLHCKPSRMAQLHVSKMIDVRMLVDRPTGEDDGWVKYKEAPPPPAGAGTRGGGGNKLAGEVGQVSTTESLLYSGVYTLNN